ncbi:MAG TPA: hypothetical protein VNI36_07360 [Candidatus Dormibacteraeota bacterium]|nr:hypothetical protein [Candidatus Dormibacteraeota bacterium]
MRNRHRNPNRFAQQVLPLLLLGIGLVASNNYLTFVDDEVRTLDAAAQPVHTLFARFFSGCGPQNMPALYTVVLHFWLRWTAGNFQYLRVPAIIFFLAGLWLLALAARRLGSQASGITMLWLGILWPYGFHYGRLAAPYSFVFFLIAGLTFAYLQLLEKESFGRWCALFLFGAALLWTNFFGWAVVACLGIDQLIRRRAGEPAMSVRAMGRTAILWIAVCIPVFRPLYREFIAGANIHNGFRAAITSCAYYIYTLFVSESVAPWHWQLSVPAGLAILVCIVLVSMQPSWPARRFLAYGAVLVILMAAAGILFSPQLVFVAPWVLLPIAVAIGSIKSRWAQPVLAVMLLIIAGVGWTGIYARQYYSAPQFLEPWVQEAGDVAGKIQTGATVISNSRPFFLYLTYVLRPPTRSPGAGFEGFFPDSIHQPSVNSANQWLSSGHPMAPVMIWIHGVSDPQAEKPMEDAAHELDRSCGSRVSRLMSRDQGYEWKQRFLPEIAGAQWRIEVREYDCGPNSSQEIFPIPAH